MLKSLRESFLPSGQVAGKYLGSAFMSICFGRKCQSCQGGCHAHKLCLLLPFSPSQSTLHTVTCHEKVVAVRKDHTESLGMTVAGGASNREWDLPIYVISVEPGGVISRDSRIKTGKRGWFWKPAFKSRASFEKWGIVKELHTDIFSNPICVGLESLKSATRKGIIDSSNHLCEVGCSNILVEKKR